MDPQVTYEQAVDYLTIVRDMIKHENELVNQRLTWMFTLQGPLFAASSFLWKENILPVMVFGFVGITSNILICYTPNRGLKNSKRLLLE
jgi:hypothetical protein